MKTIIAAWMVVTSLASGAAQSDIGPPMGRMVDIGARQLHVHCTGSGSPTVVLEAGASSFAIDFSLVQPEIAKTNRICSYDRAGMGWSGPRGEVETPARVVADLHALLGAVGEKPPYVMVGASRGGIYVRLYQLEYPSEVAGLVLLDPATEDRLFTMFEGKMVAIGALTDEQFRSTLPTSGSFPIRSRSPQMGGPFDLLPKDLYERRVELDRRLIASMPPSVSVEVVRESQEGEHAALARLLRSRTLKEPPMHATPTVVLTRGLDQSQGMVETHQGLAKLSTHSRHTVVPNAGHEIHLFAPAVVIQAIQDVVEAHRKGGGLPEIESVGRHFN